MTTPKTTKHSLPTPSPVDDDLDFSDGSLDDDDPAVIEGMTRLGTLREAEGDIAEL